DFLYQHEAPGFLALSMHCHFGGRPMISAIFEKLFKYMAQFPEVWFASYGEIARWVIEHKLEPDPRRLLKAGESGEGGGEERNHDLRSFSRKRKSRAENSAKELGPRFRGDERKLTTHYSLLTTHYSLLTTHYSLLLHPRRPKAAASLCEQA